MSHILSGEEVLLVRSVFENVLGSKWQQIDGQSHPKLASVLIRAIAEGVTDPEKLASLCIAWINSKAVLEAA